MKNRPWTAVLAAATFSILLAGCPADNPSSPSSPAGTATFTPAVTSSSTAAASSTATGTPTETATPTQTGTPTWTATDSPSPTATGTPTETATSTETGTPTWTATDSPSPTATGTPTETATPTETGTPTWTATVTNTPTNTLQPTPVLVATYTAPGGYNGVRGLAWNGTSLYVCDKAVSQVFKLNSDLTPDPAWTAPTVSGAEGVGVDGGGNLWVCGGSTNTLSEFNSMATPVATVATAHSDYGIAFDDTGDFYVTDLSTSTVTKYTGAGAPVSVWSVPGNPVGIAIAGSPQTVYLGLAGNNVIATYDTDGNALPVSWTAPNQNLALAFNGSGDLYAVGDGWVEAARFTPLGLLQTEWGSFLSIGLAVDTAGNIYIGNYSSGTVSKYTP